MNTKEELSTMANRPENWFKATEGTHQVEILKEPSDEDVVPKEFDGRKVTQVNLKIKVGGEEKDWSITKGATLKSLWGQLTVFAQYCNGGKYAGKPFKLIVKGEGKTKDYTVYDALDFISKATEDFKEKGAKEGTVKEPSIGEEPIGSPLSGFG